MNHDYREMETMHTRTVATRTTAGGARGRESGFINLDEMRARVRAQSIVHVRR